MKASTRLAIAAVLLCFSSTTAVSAATPDAWVRQHLPELVDLYRELHQAPELSFQEVKTSQRMAAEMKALGCDVTTEFGGHGVVAILANGPGPKLMIRADMDALPVVEQTGLVYASKVTTKDEMGATVGTMHACGHDIHMTNLIGVARYLAVNKDRYSGTIMFLFQPAEERGSGAKKMVDAGLFTKFFKPDFSLALHVDGTLAAGSIGYKAGYFLANVDSVDITVRGRGGHGAYPQTTIDPIVEAARLILDLQTIVSREIKPTEPAVITVGSIHGGAKHNIIADSCHLQLTVRSYSDEVRKHLLAAIQRKAKAAAASSGAPEPTIVVSEGTPATKNDAKLVERVVPTFRRVLGDDKVTNTEPSMGGEDYSEFGLAGVPIFMFQLGSVEAQRLAGFKRVGQPPSLHSPLYFPDAEPTLATGVVAMISAVLDLLPAKK